MNQTPRHRQIRGRIATIYLPQAMTRFFEKNEDYGVGSDEFGPKAQIMDISRKYKKIKAAIWDGEELTGEPIHEVIDDMIGHLLLLRESISLPLDTAMDDYPAFSAAVWLSAYDEAMEANSVG